MPRIDVNGESLFYLRAGAGQPLILIHSLGTASWLWREQIERWSNDFDVVAIDARGHGQTTCNGGFTVRAVAGDIAALGKALALEPAHVVAISMGGPIAAHLVDLAPQVVRSLVIAGSFATQGEAGAARVEAIEETIRSGTMADFGRHYAKETLAADDAPDTFEELAASIGRMSGEAYIEAARSVFTSDVTAILQTISLPTLVVVGSRDQRTPPRLSDEIVDLIDGAAFRMIDGARHLSNLDRPDGFHAAVEPFLYKAAGLRAPTGA